MATIKRPSRSAAAVSVGVIPPVRFTGPLLYELKGGRTEIRFFKSGASGQPEFNYKDARRELSFSGTEVATVETDFGTLVTVIVGNVPDLHTERFTVVLPHVRLNSNLEVDLTTVGINSFRSAPPQVAPIVRLNPDGTDTVLNPLPPVQADRYKGHQSHRQGVRSRVVSTATTS